GAHRAREGLGDLGELVEIEVELAGEAGRHALGGPGVPRADGASVRNEAEEQRENQRRHDPHRRTPGPKSGDIRRLRLLEGPDPHAPTNPAAAGRRPGWPEAPVGPNPDR